MEKDREKVEEIERKRKEYRQSTQYPWRYAHRVPQGKESAERAHIAIRHLDPRDFAVKRAAISLTP